MKKLLTRSLTGAIYAVLVVSSLWINQFTFFVLFLFLLLLTLHEFYHLVGQVEKGVRIIPGITIGMVCYLFFFLYYSDLFHVGILYLLLFMPLLLFLLEIFFYRDLHLNGLALTIFGWLYIALPFSMLHSIVFFHKGMYLPIVLLGVFALIWVSDSMAYVVGSLTGRHKIFPKLSPKKSWEGYLGGLFFVLLAAWLLSKYSSMTNLKFWVVLAVLVNVAGLLGDIFESAFKRQLGIKDSGKVLPGHGGFLDRLDSLLFVAPVVSIYLSIYFMQV